MHQKKNRTVISFYSCKINQFFILIILKHLLSSNMNFISGLMVESVLYLQIRDYIIEAESLTVAHFRSEWMKTRILKMAYHS